MQPGQPKWRRRSEARPGEIVQAALEVFAEKGFAAARLDDIARQAGVSKGALYLYFETKEDLFRAVVRQAVAPNLDLVEVMLAHTTLPFPDLLRLLSARIVMVIGASRMGAVAKLVIGESRNFPELARVWHDAVVSRALTTLTRIVIPLMRPGIAVVFIFVFIQAWGNFFVPFVLLLSPDKVPAAVSIFNFFGQYGAVAYGQLAAFSIIYSVPVIALYVLVSRGLGGGNALAGGIKG